MPRLADTKQAPKAQRAAWRIASAIVQRGLIELQPRKSAHGKLTATVVHQLAANQKGLPRQVVLAMPGDAAEADFVMRLLPDYERVEWTAPHWAGVLSRLFDANQAATAPTIFAAAGVYGMSAGNEHADLSLAFSRVGDGGAGAFLRQLMQTTGRRVGERLDHQSTHAERLVFEDRPGRAAVLGIEEATLRGQSKRWQTVLAAKDAETAQAGLGTQSGWGLGAVAMAPSSLAEFGKPVTLVRQTSSCADDAVTLGAVDEIVEAFTAWLKDAGGFGAVPRSVYLSVPSLHVASALATRLAATGVPLSGIEAPDLLYGWQPLLTLKEFLASAPRPAALIYTGSYPSVDFLGVLP